MALSEQQIEALKAQYFKDISSVMNNPALNSSQKRSAIAFITRSAVHENPTMTDKQYEAIVRVAKKIVHPDVSKFSQQDTTMVNDTVGDKRNFDAIKKYTDIQKQAERNPRIMGLSILDGQIQHQVFYNSATNEVTYPPHLSADETVQLSKKAVPEIERAVQRQSQHQSQQQQQKQQQRATQEPPREQPAEHQEPERAQQEEQPSTAKQPYTRAEEESLYKSLVEKSMEKGFYKNSTWRPIVFAPTGNPEQGVVTGFYNPAEPDSTRRIVFPDNITDGQREAFLNGTEAKRAEIKENYRRSQSAQSAPQQPEQQEAVREKATAAKGNTYSKPRIIDFDLNVDRNAPFQYHSDGDVSAARVGKTNGSGIVEDNGVGISNIAKDRIGFETAYDRLRNLFNAVRNQPSTRGTQIAATAATAITSLDGVTWRGAGDAPVVAIGDNGKVIVLNKFHVAGGEVVANTLQPGSAGWSDQLEAGHKTWAELEKELGTKKIRIAVMSDGLSSSHSPEHVATDIEQLIRLKKINFDDPNWAAHLLEAGSSQKINGTRYENHKNDDRIVVSAKRPTRASEQALIGAFDGVGSGGAESARIARIAVEAAREEAKVISRAHPGPAETEPTARQATTGTDYENHPQYGKPRGRAANGYYEYVMPDGKILQLNPNPNDVPPRDNRAAQPEEQRAQAKPAQPHSHWKLDPTSADYAQKLAELRSLKITKTIISPEGTIHLTGTHPTTGEKITTALNKEQYKIVDPVNHTLQFGTPAERQALQQEMQRQQQAQQQQGTEPQQEQRQQQQQSRDQRGGDAKPADAKPVDTKPADVKTPANTAPHKSDAKIAGRINGAGLGVGVLGVAMADDPTAKTVAAAQATAGFAGLAANLKLIQNSPGAAKLLAAGLLFANGGLTIAQAKLEWEKLSAKEKAQLAGAGIIGFIPVVAGAAITSFLTATFPPLAPFAGAVTAAVGVLAGAVGAGIGGAIYEIGAGINEGIAHFGKGIDNFKQGNIGAGIWNIVDGLVTINPTIYNKTFLKAGLSLVEGTVGSIAGMGAMVVAGIPKIGGIAADWLGSGLNAMGFTNAGEGLKNWGKKLDGAAGWVMQKFQQAQEGYTHAKEKVFDTVGKVYEGAKEAVNTAVKEVIKDPIGAIGTALTAPVKGLWNGIKAGWNWLVPSAQAAPMVPEAVKTEPPKTVPPKADAPTQVSPPRPVPMPTPEATFPKFHSANINHLPDFKIIGKQAGIQGGNGFGMKEQAPRYMVEFPDGRRAWMQDTGKMLLSNPPQSSVTFDYVDKNGKPVTDKDGKPVVEQRNMPTGDLNAAISKWNNPGQPNVAKKDEPILSDLVYRHPINIKIGGGVVTEADKRRGEFLDMLGLPRDQIQLLPHRITGLAERNPGYTALLMAMEAIQPGSMKNLRIEDMKQGKIPDSMKGLLVDAAALLKFGDATTTVKGQTNIFDYMQTRTQTLFPEPQLNQTIAKFVDAGQPKAAQPILTDEQRKQITALREVQKTAQVVK